MIVYVVFEAYYGQDLVDGTSPKGFLDEQKAVEFCKKRQAYYDKNKHNTIDVKYWRIIAR